MAKKERPNQGLTQSGSFGPAAEMAAAALEREQASLHPNDALLQWQTYANQQRLRAEAAEARAEAAEAKLPRRTFTFGPPGGGITHRILALDEAAARRQLPAGAELAFRGCV